MDAVGRRLRGLEGSAARIAGLIAVLGLLVGIAVWWGSNHPEVAMVAAMAIVAPLPPIIRAAQGRFDPFEPIHVMALGIFVLFVVRPAAELGYGIDAYFNMPIRDGFVMAMGIALVGTSALYLGYFSGIGGRISGRFRPLPNTWDTDRSIRFVIGLLILAGLLTIGFMGALGGPGALFRFFLGRTQQDSSQALSTVGYVAFGIMLVIPATFILLHALKTKKTLAVRLLFVVTLAVAAFITIPRGDRTNVIALLLPLIVLYYLRRGTRPSVRAIIVAVLGSVLLLNVLLGLRRQETRAQNGVVNTIVNAVTHPGDQLHDFLVGVDLAEFTVLELEAEAVQSTTWHLDYHPGATVASVVVGPLPRKLIHSKPQSGLEYVTDHIFPTNTRRASFGPSMFGDLFADWGWISLVFFSFLIGVGTRTLWDYFLRYSSNEGMQIFFAACLPLLVILTRNSLPDILARSFFLALPLVVCLIVCSRPPARILAGYRVRPASSPATPVRSASP